MIIGNGQIANIFTNDPDQQKYQHVCIFASGVSNSNCTDLKEFKREEELLLEVLNDNRDKKFIYFSSCALSVTNYPKNDYYNHKLKMENKIIETAKNYLICRVPQLFGELIKHTTLVNYIYNAVVDSKEFVVYNGAYRYVIDIEDLKVIVDFLISEKKPKSYTIDIGNYKKYSILEIVETIEKLVKKKGKYKLVDKNDEHDLSFLGLKDILQKTDIGIGFSKDYFECKFKNRLKNIKGF